MRIIMHAYDVATRTEARTWGCGWFVGMDRWTTVAIRDPPVCPRNPSLRSDFLSDPRTRYGPTTTSRTRTGQTQFGTDPTWELLK
jgi:hypothetical protein